MEKKIFSCNLDTETISELKRMVMDLGFIYGRKGKNPPKPNWGGFFRAIVRGELILSKPIDRHR